MTAGLHVLATATYVVATVALLVALLPAARREPDPRAQRRLLARWLRRYNVASVGALGVLVITGASMVTDWKAMLGAEFGRLVWRLAGKLALTFVLINVATYLSFGLAHRLVVAELGQLPVDPAKQTGMLRRMSTAAWLGLGLALWTAWVGYRLGG